MAAPVCSSTNHARGPPFPHILTNTSCFLLLFSRQNRQSTRFFQAPLAGGWITLPLISPLSRVFWRDVEILGTVPAFSLNPRMILPFPSMVATPRGFGSCTGIFFLGFTRFCSWVSEVFICFFCFFDFSFCCFVLTLGRISPYFELSYMFKYMFVAT